MGVPDRKPDKCFANIHLVNHLRNIGVPLAISDRAPLTDVGVELQNERVQSHGEERLGRPIVLSPHRADSVSNELHHVKYLFRGHHIEHHGTVFDNSRIAIAKNASTFCTVISSQQPQGGSPAWHKVKWDALFLEKGPHRADVDLVGLVTQIRR